MKFKGTMYKEPCVLILGVTDSVFPTFGTLQEILIDREEVLFVVKMYETVYTTMPMSLRSSYC